MSDLPTGTVTFLFTDLEGSTRLWEQHPETMKAALARHDEILRGTIAAHDGYVVKMRGDGAHAVFADPSQAVDAALDAQRSLSDESWGEPGELRVRIGVHTGPAEQRDGDYFGTAVNRAARVMSAAHGGQVLVSLTTAELLRDAGAQIDLIDLGEHRLRDLSTDEHLFQLAADGLVRDFPLLRTLDAYLGNLPPQTTSFIGRESEVADISDALWSSRVVTITGAGGVGKTRLATQVAAEVLPAFPGGAWLCELAAAIDDDTMLSVVAATLGVRPQGPLQAALVEYLRSRHALLVFDNCEHLLESVARFVEAIVRGCPDVTVLATSREGFGVPGEQVWPLRTLAVPALDDTLDKLADCDAVRLFSERARSVKPTFTLGSANAAAVAEICRRLDGVPLAIELAAARVAVMNPDDIAKRLDERFRLLTGGRRTAVERHQTLRATVEWSYSLLSPRAQRVFDRLGVFAGSFDADAVENIVTDDDIDAWDALDALADLVSKSMVNQDESAAGASRYRMLETLRQYARERLDERDADGWRRRHAQYFARLAFDISVGLEGRDELAWRRRLGEEIDNLRAAVVWALDADDPEDVQLAHRIISQAVGSMAANWAMALSAWADRAVERLDVVPPELHGGVLVAAGWCAFGMGDWVKMRELSEAAVHAVPASQSSGSIEPYFVLAIALTMLRDADAFREAVDQGFRIAGERGGGLAAVQLMIIDASQAAAVGDLARMRERADACRAEARRLNVPSALQAALYPWAWANMSLDPAGAEALLEQAMSTYAAEADLSQVPRPMVGSLLARLRAGHGNKAGAVDALTDAVSASRDLMNRGALVTSLERGVHVFVACDRPEVAAVLAGAATRGPLRDMRMTALHERAPRREIQDRIREQIGDERYEECMARGAALSYEESVSYALAELEAVRAELTSTDG